ncbi:MAG: four helix bundle protein [Bacteroidota bacterium]
MHQYKKLTVWQKAMNLSIEVYKVTRKFPTEEKFGLTQQIRRSAVSIPSNIAEGSGRRSEKEFKYFLSVAYGSACELETQLIIANRNGFLLNNDFKYLSKEIFEIQKMTYKISNL